LRFSLFFLKFFEEKNPALAKKKTLLSLLPVRFVPITSSHCSLFILSISVSLVIPALFTSTSTVPHLATASSTRRWMSSPLDRSAPTTIASPPEALICDATSSAAPALEA